LRVSSIEKISDETPGELGKLLGLDRIPEVKTLRNKIKVLSQDEQPDIWLSQLSKDWMINAPDLAGVLYIDGHEGVYYGKNNKLPRRYISRLRLAMRATTDYYVNDKLGQPFFSVSKHVSGSMIETIKLAERGVLLEGKESEKLSEPITVYTIENTEDGVKIKTTNKRTQKKRKIWAREVRKLSDNKQQTSIITTNYKLSLVLIGLYMFARWCQENYFKYMIKNYGLDMLISNYRQKKNHLRRIARRRKI